MSRWWIRSGQFLFAGLFTVFFIVLAVLRGAHALAAAGAALGLVAYGYWRLDQRYR